MPFDVVLIRHAQPEWVKDGLGVDDPPLTELGRAQARALAASIDWRNVNALWVSPTQRTRETAAPLAEALGQAPRIVEDLREIETPTWEGVAAAEVSRVLTESRGRTVEQWWQGLEGGEETHGFGRRVTAALAGLLAERGVERNGDEALLKWTTSGADGRVVLVGHNGTNAALIGWLLGVEPVPWPWERFCADHASVCRLKLTPVAGGHIFGLRSFNRVDHLHNIGRSR